MENKQYKVIRDKVYVGVVVNATQIDAKKYKCPYDLVKQGQLYATGYRSYRSMLFVPNQYLLANDLLYNSPNYPILNVSKPIVCWNTYLTTPIISESINIGDLLKYFGYAEELGYSDIMKIRKSFFNGTFAKDHCELFGYIEDATEDALFLDGSENIKVNQRQAGRRFHGVYDHVLAPEYFTALNMNGDRSISDLLNGYCNATDAFRPHKDEVLVRKLTI